jgi:hypothetical protein
MPKFKAFEWLLLMDRLNTKNIMTRRNWQVEGGNCVLCNIQQEETRDHLFFDCAFAKQCWEFLDIQWDLVAPIFTRISLADSNFNGPCFMEVISCASWNIWKEQND